MRIRAVDGNGDWLFGKGQNDYVTRQAAVRQNIESRLREFLGDSFWNVGGGVDWFNLLGSKNPVAINLAVSAVILNTADVTGVRQASVSLDVARKLSVKYVATSIFSQISGNFQFDLNPTG